MNANYENVKLPIEVIQKIDIVLKYLDSPKFKSRPKLVSSFIKGYIDGLVNLGYIKREELN